MDKQQLTHFIILFFALMLAQAVCSRIVLFNAAVPIVFIYFILRQPLTLNINRLLTYSFIAGITVDMFCNTQGMNALCCTVLAMLRKPVFDLYIPNDDEENNPIPSMSSLGVMNYLKYMVTLVTAYCAMLFIIQAFTLHNLPLTLLRIVASTVLSALLIFGIDSLVSVNGEKRL